MIDMQHCAWRLFVFTCFDQVHPNLGSCFGLCMLRCLLEPLYVFAVWQNLVVTALLHDFASDFLAFRVPYDLRSLGSVSFISMIQRSPCLSLKRVKEQWKDTAGVLCIKHAFQTETKNALDEQRRGGRERRLITTILSAPSQTWSQEASSRRILQRH